MGLTVDLALNIGECHIYLTLKKSYSIDHTHESELKLMY